MRLVWVVLVTACYQPSPPEGSPCASQTECPDPLVCDRGSCVETPSEIDAASIDAELPDGPNAGCTCAGDTLACAGGDTQCALGCVEDSPARCRVLVPSNGVGLDDLALVDVDITLAGTATFDTDTGEITGALARDAGIGVDAGIAYERRPGLGVFTFHQLVVSDTGAVRFIGSRAAVFVVETSATIAGSIDGSGNCAGTIGCAGPGGGAGATAAAIATGCGPGANGVTGATSADGGGAGGGAGAAGAAGGTGTNGAGTGGAAGIACLGTDSEPLVGGSGGGAGSPGSAIAASGGGGGGAFQLTALESITIAGRIVMAGGGGGAGPGGVANTNAGGGGGGGAGGAILLEAPAVMVSGILAANGGGGGSSGSTTMVGTAGANGAATATPAAGGAQVGMGGAGGAGGAGVTAAAAGANAASNGGGGGGAVGIVFARALGAPSLAGTISPAAGTGPLVTD